MKNQLWFRENVSNWNLIISISISYGKKFIESILNGNLLSKPEFAFNKKMKMNEAMNYQMKFIGKFGI